jgi:hypothetical protein
MRWLVERVYEAFDDILCFLSCATGYVPDWYIEWYERSPSCGDDSRIG